jgi:hypothetical protein
MHACVHGIEIFHEKTKMCVRCLIVGGVTKIEPFLKKFFPSVLEKMGDAKQNQYCIFDGQILTAFTSPLYVFGLLLQMLSCSVF